MKLNRTDCTDQRWKKYHSDLQDVAEKDFYKNKIMQNVVELNSTERCLDYLEEEFDKEKDYILKNFYERDFFLKYSRFLKNKLIHPHTERYIFQACLVVKLFGELKNSNIIEIGSNYGGLCRVLTMADENIQYTLVDHDNMNRFSKYFLESHDNKIWLEPKDLDNITDQKFDLFISNICLSETPKQFREWLYENIVNNCTSCFIIDGCPPTDMIEELEIMLKTLYTKQYKMPYIRKNHFVLYGTNI